MAEYEEDVNLAEDGLDVEDVLEALEQTDAVAPQTEAGRQAQDSMALLYKHHPECILDYTETVASKLPLKTAPVSEAASSDPFHQSQPFMTQFEKTKVLGFRTNQLAQGARPFVTVPEHITSVLEIARLELEQRRLPFIIKRPMPDGSFEYWRLSDLAIF
jgi:DNA-directed RNA polymerase I, II, and III subunit RPABC2